MKMNFGVIIQGPIVSFGSGGKNDNPEGFDSKKTLVGATGFEPVTSSL